MKRYHNGRQDYDEQTRETSRGRTRGSQDIQDQDVQDYSNYDSDYESTRQSQMSDDDWQGDTGRTGREQWGSWNSDYNQDGQWQGNRGNYDSRNYGNRDEYENRGRGRGGNDMQNYSRNEGNRGEYGSRSSEGRQWNQGNRGEYSGNQSNWGGYGNRGYQGSDRYDTQGNYGNQSNWGGYGNRGYGNAESYGAQGNYGNQSYYGTSGQYGNPGNYGNQRGYTNTDLDRSMGYGSNRDSSAQQEWQGTHKGKGPKGYQRSDERIKEDVNDRLTDDGRLNASGIEVEVNSGDVVLSGTVDSREDKRRAEDVVEAVSGVKNVENRLRVGSSQSDKMNKQGNTEYKDENRSNTSSSNQKQNKTA